MFSDPSVALVARECLIVGISASTLSGGNKSEKERNVSHSRGLSVLMGTARRPPDLGGGRRRGKKRGEIWPPLRTGLSRKPSLAQTKFEYRSFFRPAPLKKQHLRVAYCT